MPTPPHKGESKNSFISRCVSYLVKRENKTQDQALGQCYGMWRQAKGIKKKSDHLK
ncbi:hypothetical protein LCGC14_2969280 [marine sediment metagenome]|uniref:Uncharacterized protein n=1 Tax=marine sediment metagenome TaxID=412755 RepID=A0A0F9A151_9ZZZZ